MLRAAAILLAVGLMATLAHGRDIKTLKGETYRDVTISKVTKVGISVTYADGIAFLDFANLPEELRKEFGYDEAAALEAKAAERARVEAAAQMLALQRELAASRERERAAIIQAGAARAAAEQIASTRAVHVTAAVVPEPVESEVVYSPDRYSSRSYAPKTVSVSGYRRKDGTYVKSYKRSR